jgi:hypothetical protein
MNWRVKNLLRELVDGEWHDTIAAKGVGVGTVNLCIDQGFIDTKRLTVKRDGPLESYTISLRITKKGRDLITKKK